MTDQERKDLAVAYRTMMDLAAWKHFETTILDHIEALATKTEDDIPVTTLDHCIGQIGECRGRRAAVQKIRSDLRWIIKGDLT